MERYLELAYRISLSGQHSAHLMGAVVVRGGAVLSSASNRSRGQWERNVGLHAEERALKDKRNWKGSTLIVVRSKPDGRRATMSKPCPRCMSKIVAAGIKKIVYVDWNGQMVVEKVRPVA